MRRFIQLTAITILAACGNADAAPGGAAPAEAAPITPAAASVAAAPAATASLAAASVAEQALPTVVVYKSPTCGCCSGWVEHMRAAGFTVEAHDVDDIMAVKTDHGVPDPVVTCHTAIIDGYVVEGHVPAQAVKRMLADRPDIAGIAVPGMPVGSPGMEGPNPQPYQVIAFNDDGGLAVYAEVDPR